MRHYPVLLDEVEDLLAIRPEGVYLDATAGAGGYSERIASRLDTGRLIVMDRDADALDETRRRLERFGEKVSFYGGAYSEIEQAAGDAAPLLGIVADLGLSRMQLADAERGFSFQAAGPLDMRMDRRQALTAEDVVNHWDEVSLADAIWRWGDERRSRRIARAIVRERPIRDTAHLAAVVGKAVPRTKKSRIHPATKTFQGIRVAVNDEMAELDRFLEVAPALLAKGGRMAAVSFQSHEDRRVKLAFRELARTDKFELLTRRPVRPSDQEVGENPASRSAKLRAMERTG